MVELQKRIYTQGLTGEEVKTFGELLLKANVPQLLQMRSNINFEVEKRNHHENL